MAVFNSFAAFMSAGFADLSRASEAWMPDGDGGFIRFGQGELRRLNDIGAYLEPGETYYPVNSALAGAVEGLVGAGGATPTDWSLSSAFTETAVVAIGTHGGLPTITLDLKLDNTGGGSSMSALVRLNDEPTAAKGQTWTAAIYSDVVEVYPDDTAAGAVERLQVQERNTANGFVANASVVLAGAGINTRRSVTRTLTGDATARLQIFYEWNGVPSGTVLHRRVRLKMPTLTRSGTLSTPMVTTNVGTVQRLADALTLDSKVGNALDWSIRYGDDSTASLASNHTGPIVIDPATLARPDVKAIWAELAS